jgi:hypothetical protein
VGEVHATQAAILTLRMKSVNGRRRAIEMDVRDVRANLRPRLSLAQGSPGVPFNGIPELVVIDLKRPGFPGGSGYWIPIKGWSVRYAS